MLVLNQPWQKRRRFSLLKEWAWVISIFKSKKGEPISNVDNLKGKSSCRSNSLWIVLITLGFLFFFLFSYSFFSVFFLFPSPFFLSHRVPLYYAHLAILSLNSFWPVVGVLPGLPIGLLTVQPPPLLHCVDCAMLIPNKSGFVLFFTSLGTPI